MGCDGSRSIIRPGVRLWDEIRARLCDETIKNATVHNKFFVPLRSVVYSPVQYRNLFLAGNAVHPACGKRMNLAVYDVDILAQALLSAVHDRDTTGLENYSNTCLPYIWNYQDFAVWMTDMMHDAGDSTLRCTFRQMTARARLDNLFKSPTAGRLHSEYQRGMNCPLDQVSH
ncbi:FAD-dependent monooxygenase [Pedobacter sp. NJ-S-72]